jgi:hypothetical protein
MGDTVVTGIGGVTLLAVVADIDEATDGAMTIFNNN